MITTTALPREKKMGAKELVGRFLGSLPFFRMDDSRPKINLSPSGERLPIKKEPLKDQSTAARRTIAPGVPLLAEGFGENIKHYIVVGEDRFDIDQYCHLKDITKVNENWEKTIAASKGIIVYDDECKAIVSYVRNFYIDNKRMPALQRICQENGRENMCLSRNRVYELFTKQPTRVIAAVAGLPSNYENEKLQKPPKFPSW